MQGKPKSCLTILSGSNKMEPIVQTHQQYDNNEQNRVIVRNVTFAISSTTIDLDQITKGQRLNGSDDTVASGRR